MATTNSSLAFFVASVHGEDYIGEIDAVAVQQAFHGALKGYIASQKTFIDEAGAATIAFFENNKGSNVKKADIVASVKLAMVSAGVCTSDQAAKSCEAWLAANEGTRDSGKIVGRVGGPGGGFFVWADAHKALTAEERALAKLEAKVAAIKAKMVKAA